MTEPYQIDRRLKWLRVPLRGCHVLPVATASVISCVSVCCVAMPIPRIYGSPFLLFLSSFLSPPTPFVVVFLVVFCFCFLGLPDAI